MAVMFGSDEEGQFYTWRNDPDTGKPIRFRIRAVEADVDRRIRSKHTSTIRTDEVSKQRLHKSMSMAEDIVRERAAYALLETEGFVAAIANDKAAEKFTEAGVQASAGAEVCLDGKWTDALKVLVLSEAPKLASWISERADERRNHEAQEDADRDQSFR